MGLTVSNQSQYLYQAYSLANSDTCQQNAVDSDAVAEEKYNISDFSGALDVLEKASNIGYDCVGNLTSYVKDAYRSGELGLYEPSAGSANIAGLLSGKASSDDIYDLIAYCNSLSADELKSLTGTEARAQENYTEYLNSNNTIDIIA